MPGDHGLADDLHRFVSTFASQNLSSTKGLVASIRGRNLQPATIPSYYRLLHSLSKALFIPPYPQAIYLIVTGAREAAFRNIKTIAECLADELINAAKGSSNSYAIKKKDELERVAKVTLPTDPL